MRFSVYQVSRKGGREKNEDRMGYCYTRDAGLSALADGMGGHPEGEVASQLALQTLAALFQRDAKPTLSEPLRFLHEAIIAGHHQLLRYATEKALIDTPRTTVVASAGPLLRQPRDRVLLCSDGLWGSVSDAVITEHLASLPISDAVPELVELALRNGGAKSDNVTVLSAEWEAAEDGDGSAEVSTQALGEEVFASTIQRSEER